MTSAEQICHCYFKSKGCFVLDKVGYDRSTSQIALLAVDLKEQCIYDVEVKLYNSKAMYQSKFDHSVASLKHFKREMKIQSLFSDDLIHQFAIKKWFVTSSFTAKEWVHAYLDEGIEVHFISDLVEELKEMMKKNTVHQDVVAHIIEIMMSKE